MALYSTNKLISAKSQLNGNLGNINIVKKFESKLQHLSFICIVLIMNCISRTTAAASNIGGGMSMDAKTPGGNQDTRMLPAEVYPWNILGVPDYSIENDMTKRSSWQKLHGSWGKRNIIENGINANGYHNMENFDETNNLVNGNGNNNNNNGDGNNDGYNEIESHDGPTDRDYQELIKFEEIYSLPSSVVNDLLKPSALYNEKKRAWRNLNVAWGKRRPSNEWNKFRVGYCSRLLGCLDWYNFILKLDILKSRDPELASQDEFEGAWGKREPGWNNLKGLWGKRASNWNKLNSAWGKRSEDTIESATN